MMMIERMGRSMAGVEGGPMFYERLARAALTALLEPSDDMIEAGRDAVRDGAYYSDVQAAFCAAIQAALDEKEG